MKRSRFLVQLSTMLVAVLFPAISSAGGFKNYLDPPRINIAGQFFTDPSTVNNDPKHYTDQVTRPSPWQEPMGRHHWRLVDCSVRSVLAPDGKRQSKDPLIGAAVLSADEPSPAKIVDLDVYQQATSTIYGFALKIPLPGGGELVARMDPATLNSAWLGRVLPTRGWNQNYGWGSYGGDANMSGFFQTLLRVPDSDWPQSSGSPTLDALREACDEVDGMRLISFRFVLDGYFNVSHHQDYRYGRFTGSLGPGSAEAPVQTPGHRWLNPRPLPPDAAWYVPMFYGAPFKVDPQRKKLIVDLANSLAMESPRSVPVDLGDFRAVVHDDAGNVVTLGRLDESAFVYEDLSSIIEIDLDDEGLALIEDRPLFLVTSRQDIGGPTLFQEDRQGLHYAVDTRVLRMTSEPESRWVERGTRVHVTRWGRPEAGFDFRLDIVPVTGSTPGNTAGDPADPGDTSQAWGAIQGKISSSDENGFAEITMRVVADPGMRTPELDGQLYFIYPLPAEGEWTAPIQGGMETQEHQLSVLAWSRHEIAENPTWDEVAEIMAPYMKLFPSMRGIIDLTDHHSFEVYSLNPPWVVFGEPPTYSVDGISAGAIPFLMTRDINDPRYMPVTRDLSPGRTQTVLNWIRNAQKGIQPTPPPPEAGGHASASEGSSP
jgi:hypothetical protein